MKFFKTIIDKAGLKREEHEELVRLGNLWEENCNDRVFHFALHGRRVFVLTAVYVAGGHTTVVVGSVKECLAYLRGAIYGLTNMANP